MLALAQYLPRLAARIPSVALGDWPTPVHPFEIDGRTLWIKDEGVSNARYGGNKIRTLEMWFGHAQARGAKRIWAIGAYGSNHAIATALHAPSVGLEAGAILFPQPSSEWAVENCGALIASGIPLVRVSNIALMPFAALRIARREPSSVVMPPGGATPTGTMGALSGALELAMQIEEGLLPAPKRIVVGVGSTCTISGLVAGLSLAHAIGVWRWPVPIMHGVRVTPWPVTSPALIADLAYRTLARVERLGGPRVATSRRELLARLVVDGHELGRGYGRITERGTEAIHTLAGLHPANPKGSGHDHAHDGSGHDLAHDGSRHDHPDDGSRHDHAHDGSRHDHPDDGSRHDHPDDGSRHDLAHDGSRHDLDCPRLDGVYSAKAAAGLLRLHRAGIGPLLFWASKSHALLAPPGLDKLRAAHPALVRWLRA